MQRLTKEQRAQARKDILEIQAVNVKIQANPIVPADLKTGLSAQIRVLDTIAIAAGIFDESEG